jgi:sarcosine oxidase subunit gamma
MTTVTVTSLEHIHKKGRFGNYHKKDIKSLLQISEVKNLKIIQLVQYKKSKIQPSTIKIGDLDLPLESPKVTMNKETRVLWNAPRTWLIISSKKNIVSSIKDKCDNENFAVTDISHSRAVIQIKGIQAKEVLKKGCPININEIQVNNCAGTVFNGITVMVDFVNNNPDTFNLLALRSFGETFHHHITDAALEFGYFGV